MRESVRKALDKRGMKFDSREELIQGTKKIGRVKYNFDYENILKKSKLLSKIKTQMNLIKWF